MAATLTVPWDEWAEEAVVGCAIATCHGAQLAASRLTAGDFYKPGHRRLFEAAVACDLVDQGGRMATICALADVSEVEVLRLVDDRPAHVDANGSFAARVLDAARRRQVMQVCADLHNALGSGARLEEILPVLTKIGIGVSA